MLDFIVKVLFLAVTIAFLGAWGMMKEQRKSKELIDKIYAKMQKKVRRSLQKNENLSMSEIEALLCNTKASLFWSKQKVKITDSKTAARTIIEKMLKEDIIVESFDKKRKVYRLNQEVLEIE